MNAPRETWILLRGLARENGHWGSFPAALARNFPAAKILPLDSPGNGLRWRERSPLTVRETMEAVRAQALRECAPGSVLHVLALSLGGMIAAEWMAAYPGEIKKAILVNSSLRGLSPFWKRLRPEAWLTFFLLAVCPVMAWREALILGLISNRRDHGLLPAWIELQRERPTTLGNAIRQLLAAARFSAPPPPTAAKVKILGSQGDRLCHWRCSEAIASHWHADLRLHPNAGHDLPVDDSAWLLEQLRG
ncbi:MAG: alpha/beta hydrolase [Bdellovibrionales bacterium]|nr:alpha/beta hydrolase [Bdellovibrionales bacterium]